jgi:hypothetical protein
VYPTHPVPPVASVQPYRPVASVTGSQPASKATSFEAVVGIGVLSVLGSLFLLIGFLIFGLNYLEGIVQGIFLYVIPGIIILLSELLLQKRIPKFASVVSGLGVAAMYIAIIINYQGLHNINIFVAALEIIVIAAVSLLIGRRNDSTGIRLTSLIGCYISFLSLGSFETTLDFFVATGILMLVNGVGIFLPNQKNRSSINQIHMLINTLFAILFGLLAYRDGISLLYIIFFINLNIVLLNIVFLKQGQKQSDMVWFSVEQGILQLILLGLAAGPQFRWGLSSFDWRDDMMLAFYSRIIILGLALAITIFFGLFSKRQSGKILHYYHFMTFAFLMVCIYFKGVTVLWAMLILFVTVKLFSHAKELEIMNGVITVFACLIGLALYDMWPGWILFGAFILSILLIRHCRLFHQYMITLFVILFVALNTQYFETFHMLGSVILFGLIPAFHYLELIPRNAKSTRKATIEQAYNITNLCIFTIISLCTVFTKGWLSGAVVMVVGSLYIIFYLSPRFYMGIKKKELIMAGYMIFMIFAMQIQNRLIVSIILMLIALISISWGFRIKDKSLRICGLVLALVVCAKMVLFDFTGSSTLLRMILFIIAGVLVLAISLIYTRLEKKNMKEEIR